MKTLPILSANNLRNISEQEFPELLPENICIFCEPPQKKILLETDNFYVSYDASPLAEGHILIHTKEHIGCLAEVSEELFEELLEIKQELSKTIKNIYGYVSAYEHGRAGHCSIIVDDKICHHFHLHLLPLKADLQKVMGERFRMHQMGSFNDISRLYEEFGTYLFFENADGEMYYFPAKDDLEPHYLRTIISNALGTPERADYKIYTNRDEINSFIDKLRSYYNEQ